MADYEEFTNTILSARAAFQITPEGHNQFKDWIQSIRRYTFDDNLIRDIDEKLKATEIRLRISFRQFLP